MDYVWEVKVYIYSTTLDRWFPGGTYTADGTIWATERDARNARRRELSKLKKEHEKFKVLVNRKPVLSRIKHTDPELFEKIKFKVDYNIR